MDITTNDKKPQIKRTPNNVIHHPTSDAHTQADIPYGQIPEAIPEGGCYKPSTPKFRLLADRVKNIKSTDWLIKPYIPNLNLIFLHAAPKVGKTFLAIDWAMSIATGKDWHGQKVKEQGMVLYISGEGNEAIDKRFLAWCLRHNVPPEQAQIMISERVLKLPISSKDIITAALSAANEHGLKRCKLVVFDTYRRTVEGDENNNFDANKYVAAANIIQTELKCSVLVVHHSNRSNPTKMTGASSLDGAGDVLFHLDGDPSDYKAPRFLTNQFQKNAVLAPAMAFDFRLTTLPGVYVDPEEPEEGFEASLVPIRNDDSTGIKTNQSKNQPNRPSQTKGLRLLDRVLNGYEKGSYSKWVDECLKEGLGGAKKERWRVKQNIADRLQERGEISFNEAENTVTDLRHSTTHSTT